MKSIPLLLTRLTQKFWFILILVTLALSAASIPRTINLFKNISTDPVDLLPEHHPNVISLLEVRKKFDRGVNTSIVFESDDPKATLLFLQDTVKKLKQENYIGRVRDKKLGYDFFNEHKLLYLETKDLEDIKDSIDRRIQREKLSGLLIDLDSNGENEDSFAALEAKYKSRYSEESSSEYNISADGKVYSIFVESPAADSGLSAASRFQDKLEVFVQSLRPTDFHPSMKVYFSGATKVLEYRALVKDLKKVGLISGFLLFLPLLIRFRNPIHVAIMFIPLGVGIPIAFAAASFFIAKLNVSTSFLFAILGGLGIENGIHIFSRYYEQRRENVSQTDAFVDIFSHTGRAILTAVASVAVTFLLLMVNDFRGFSDFGLIAGLGLWIIFFVYFLFLPSLLLLSEKLGILKYKNVLPGQESDSTPNSGIPQTWLKPALTAFTLFSILSLVSIPFLKFEYDSKKTRANIPSVKVAREKQRLTATRVNNPAVVVVKNEAEAAALRQKIEAYKLTDTETPTIDTAKSYYDLVPPDQTKKLAIIADIKKLLDDDALSLLKGKHKEDVERFKKALVESNPVETKELPPEVVEIFKGNPQVPGEILYINPQAKMELDDGQNAMRFADDVRTVTTEYGTYHPSSDAVVFGIVLQTMLSDSRNVLLISVLTIAFFVYLDFRNGKKTAIVMLSILLGVFWLFGIMWIFGIKFNFYNMIIIPAVMGMSIDNSIHIFHRYEELGPGSLGRVLKSTGTAALLASLTNASGFFGLLFCLHQGLFSIGLLAVIGVVTCLLSTLVFLPCLLQYREKSLAKKVG